MLNIGTGSFGFLKQNRDLIWDLDTFKQQRFAQEFVLCFENKICVYSSSVGQLYTNYNVFFPREENRKLVILPNPEAHHDVFNDVPDTAVTPTGLLIVPKRVGDKMQMMLRIPSRKDQRQHRDVPIRLGMELLNAARPKGRPFLPLLMKGDLRELDEKTPSLHLHSLTVGSLDQLSQYEVQGIRDAVLDKFSELTTRADY